MTWIGPAEMISLNLIITFTTASPGKLLKLEDSFELCYTNNSDNVIGAQMLDKWPDRCISVTNGLHLSLKPRSHNSQDDDLEEADYFEPNNPSIFFLSAERDCGFGWCSPPNTCIQKRQ